MPSFIFQLASTAVAFAALQLPSATAAPINMETLNMHRSIDTEVMPVQARTPPASTIEVRQFHNIYPVMRTMSRDQYYLSTVSNLFCLASGRSVQLMPALFVYTDAK